MTLSIDGTDIGQIAEIAAIVGSIVGTLIVALIVYLMVRPPRHVRQARRAERRGELRPRAAEDAGDSEEMAALAERMEARLQVLERVLAERIEPPAPGRRGEELETGFAPADRGRDSGRKE